MTGTRVPIACTLEVTEVDGRLDAWRAALASVTARQEIEGGLRLSLAPTAPVADIAQLVVAEQACCQFFAFALTADARGVALEVTAPAEAGELVMSLFAERS